MALVLVAGGHLKLETGLRPNSAGIPCTLRLRIEALGFPASTVEFRTLKNDQKRTHAGALVAGTLKRTPRSP